MYLPLSEPSRVISDARSLWEVFVLWYNTCFCTWAWEVGTGLESQWSQTNVPSTTEAYVFSCPKLLITLFSLFRFGFCPVWYKWWFLPYLLCFFACLLVFSYDRQECRWTIRVLFESFFLYYQAWWDFFCLFAFISLIMHLLPHSVLMHTVAVVIRWEIGIILMLRRERIAITFQVAGL